MRLRASHGLNLKQGPASALLHEWLKAAHLQDEEMHSRSKTHLGADFRERCFWPSPGKPE
jgi:hypothetical protein